MAKGGHLLHGHEHLEMPLASRGPEKDRSLTQGDILGAVRQMFRSFEGMLPAPKVATDAQLDERILEAMGIEGGHHARGRPNVWHKGGGSPSLFISWRYMTPYSTPDRGAKNDPGTLTIKGLPRIRAAVRDAWGIEDPDRKFQRCIVAPGQGCPCCGFQGPAHRRHCAREGNECRRCKRACGKFQRASWLPEQYWPPYLKDYFQSHDNRSQVKMSKKTTTKKTAAGTPGMRRLGKNQLHVLEVLRRRKNPQSADRLSGTAMTPETAASVLRGLEKQGLVRRARPEDGASGTTVCTYTTQWTLAPKPEPEKALQAEPERALVPAGAEPVGFTGRFLAAYNRTVVAIWEAGRVLVEAKEEMEHGQFQGWIDNTLPISARTGQRLMQIALDPNITRTIKEHRGNHLPLPSDQKTLCEIAGLEEPEFDRLVDSRVIHPDMRRGDLRAALAADRGPADPPRQSSLPGMPETSRYAVIVADPPWQDMPLGKIEMLPVINLVADDSVLFLWVDPDMLNHAPRIMIQWGFEYRTVAFVWVRPAPSRPGSWTRKATEICLLGTRGNPKRLDAVNDLVMAPGLGGGKPDDIYGLVQELASGPYIELFARKARPGWDAWGNDPALQDGPGKDVCDMDGPCDGLAGMIEEAAEHSHPQSNE